MGDLGGSQRIVNVKLTRVRPLLAKEEQRKLETCGGIYRIKLVCILFYVFIIIIYYF